MFTIRTRDPGSYARTGTLKLAHGEVRTPAFVPLATKAVVKTLEVSEVADLGYDMVLGNTFHLFLSPGHELIKQLGGLHRFQRWDRPIITDSGGFQVFSMGHGTVADEIKGRAAQFSGERAGAILGIEEEGVRFRSYLDGSEKFMGPETSMEVQGALGSDIALVFDECTPFHADREYTARSTERTHRWLDRCLAWHEQHGPEGQLVYGIVQGGTDEDLRRSSAQAVAARDALGGIAIGGSLGEDKPQMFEVVEWTIEELPEAKPRHLLGIGEVDDLVRGVELGIDTFDCAMPTRIGRHGMAIVPDPEKRWRVDLAKARWKQADEPLLEGCPCPACEAGYSRAYLHYLLRAKEQTVMRVLTIHNLAYLQRLMAELRDAIDTNRLPAVARGGRAPGAAPVGARARARDADAFKAFESEGWSARAGTYDALMARATALAVEPLLDAAGVGPGVRVLDVGCGLGTLAAAAASRGALVTGVDLADGMLAEARRRHPSIEFVHGDAEALPFAAGAFDVALGAFVVNHLPHPERAAAELARVAARVALAMWGPEDEVAILGLPAARGRGPRPRTSRRARTPCASPTRPS